MMNSVGHACCTGAARPLARLLLCIAALLLACALRPAALHAQDPPPADTAAVPDSLALTPDTIPADTVLPPPPQLPPMTAVLPAGFATGVWTWDRDQLLSEAAITLLDLLDRIPGVHTVRSGFYLQPEAASMWGGTATRIEVELDGYLLQPFDGPAIDLSQIELVALQRLRVERTPGLLRLVLNTEEPFDARPYSRIEAGVGQPNLNMFRGAFLTPRLGIGPFGAAIDRVDVDGIDGEQPADIFTGWLKWGWLRERGGVQLEMRQSTIDRDLGSPYMADIKRRDLLVRSRWQLVDGLVAEAFAGNSSWEKEPPDTFPEPPVPGPDDPPVEDTRPKLVERESWQAGARALLTTQPVSVEAHIRGFGASELPSLDAGARAWAALGPWGGAGADIRRQSWSDGPSATSTALHAVATPVTFARLFAQWSDSDRGAPAWDDPERTVVTTSHTTLRAGGELLWRGMSFGAARLDLERDSIPPLGMPFDSTGITLGGGELTGYEFFGRVPFWRNNFALEGSATNWISGHLGPYTPALSWRAAIESRLNPLASGNLRVVARLEARHRDLSTLPPVLAENPLDGVRTVPARTLLDGYLQIRIIDVHAFLRFEDLTGAKAQDVPEQVLPGPRMFYGIKWHFSN